MEKGESKESARIAFEKVAAEREEQQKMPPRLQPELWKLHGGFSRMPKLKLPPPAAHDPRRARCDPGC